MSVSDYKLLGFICSKLLVNIFYFNYLKYFYILCF